MPRFVLRKKAYRGQAMTESILVICLCMLVLLGAMAYFLDNCGDFYLNVIKVVCLPFP